MLNCSTAMNQKYCYRHCSINENCIVISRIVIDLVQSMEIVYILIIVVRKTRVNPDDDFRK